MTARNEQLLRVMTGTLGFAAMVSVGFIVYELFAAFAVWKLLLGLLALPGAALFLLYAFHRSGPGGAFWLGVTWPRPTKPPTLSAAAAQALPRESEWAECRGANPLNPPAGPPTGSGLP